MTDDKNPDDMSGREYNEWRKRSRESWREWYNSVEGEAARQDVEMEHAERWAQEAKEADAQWVEAVEQLMGRNLDEVIEDLKHAPYAHPDTQKALEAIKRAREAEKDGWLFSGNPKKAKRIIAQNQGAIQRAARRGRKRRGKCAVVAIVGLGYGVFVVRVVESGVVDAWQSLHGA